MSDISNIIYSAVIENVLKNYNKPAQVFFLPKSTKPQTSVSSYIQGKFWHCGIIFNKYIYELFDGKKSISTLVNRKPQLDFQRAEYLDVNINIERLKKELNSGTDSVEFILRCIGKSNLSGNKRGIHHPERAFNIIKKG